MPCSSRPGLALKELRQQVEDWKVVGQWSETRGFALRLTPHKYTMLSDSNINWRIAARIIERPLLAASSRPCCAIAIASVARAMESAAPNRPPMLFDSAPFELVGR